MGRGKMARGKATKKKGKDMKTIFVIVIVVLALAFVLFMQYQKPVVEDGGELAQMPPQGGNGGDDGNGKPSSDSKKLIPTPKSYDCPININAVDYCKKNFACDAYVYACMFYCMANEWNCCMLGIYDTNKKGEETEGHAMIIGEVKPEPNHSPTDDHRFCIFEPQLGPAYNSCCWYQSKKEDRPSGDKIPRSCFPILGLNGDVLRVECAVEDILKIDGDFKLNKNQCNELNDIFASEGFPEVNVCPIKNK